MGQLNLLIVLLRTLAWGRFQEESTHREVLYTEKEVTLRIIAHGDRRQAIVQTGKALDAMPPNDTNLLKHLSDIGSCLVTRDERAIQPNDLNQAIHWLREVVDMTTYRDDGHSEYLSSLGNLLALRYTREGQPADIWLAILFLEQALASAPANSPNRMYWLSSLATILAWKYEKTHSLVDLQYAILRSQETLGATPKDHPNRAAVLCKLGDLLHFRHAHERKTAADGDRNLDGYKACLLCYSGSWSCCNGSPVVRIKAAQKGANIFLSLGHWGEAISLLTQALELLVKISSHDLKEPYQQRMLRQFAGLPMSAASAILSTNTTQKKAVKALQILELGRDVTSKIWLGFAHGPPQRRDKFNESTPSVDTAWAANERQTFDFRTALYSPIEGDIMALATKGPVVVINVSPFRCDALLIETNAIRQLPLPNLHYLDIVQKVELLKSFNSPTKRTYQDRSNMLDLLEWLWDAVAEPILKDLEFREPPVGNNWPHIWWIPTGLLSLLPLHAAGHHRSSSFETVIDRVVSSYSPSLNALLYARRMPVNQYRTTEEALLVSMETTPECSPLGMAKNEMSTVETLLPSSISKIKLENPCKEAVMNSLRQCHIFHFTGHSVPDPVEPTKSRLLLQDWQQDPLTVEDIVNLKRHDHQPFLAYLSACSTGTSCAEEESINLMTACQIGGFRHTVGSMWDVYDTYSVDAARVFYGTLVSNAMAEDHAAALGVHLAARHIRNTFLDGKESDPFAWAAYIHMGP
ncbi:hypothetical protein M426DRAFT_14735 [Hypoxylon sp. CI-4A]|nr:hypothetical protein M426DRAFT_14735 [Hypoxylon sp. CI-4A]